MTDIGIPIPRVKPNAIFCAGCGETGTHADTCPGLAYTTPATAAEAATLRGMIFALIEHGKAVDRRLCDLEDRLFRVIDYSNQQDRNAAECTIALESRLSALEAKRKK